MFPSIVSNVQSSFKNMGLFFNTSFIFRPLSSITVDHRSGLRQPAFARDLLFPCHSLRWSIHLLRCPCFNGCTISWGIFIGFLKLHTSFISCHTDYFFLSQLYFPFFSLFLSLSCRNKCVWVCMGICVCACVKNKKTVWKIRMTYFSRGISYKMKIISLPKTNWD